MLNPALQDCGQFSKLVSLMPAHTAAEAAVALPQFLAAANLLTETEVALTTDALDVSNLLEHIIAVAGAEWDFFGKQSYDGGGHLVHAGHTEGEEGFYERIGTYWLVGTGTHSVDGRNHDMPWSAAFISWVFRTAGAGTRFRYSTQHSVYISQGIRDFLNKRTDAGFGCMRLNERQPQPGDLVCWSRQQGIDYDHQNGGNYAGHTDIVTKVSDGQVFVIGGNVGDSVSRRILRTNSSGFLNPVAQGGETLFGLMANRLG